jgi:hypothetical protein
VEKWLVNCLTTLGESMIGIITSISTKETNILIYKPQNFSKVVKLECSNVYFYKKKSLRVINTHFFSLRVPR